MRILMVIHSPTNYYLFYHSIKKSTKYFVNHFIRRSYSFTELFSRHFHFYPLATFCIFRCLNYLFHFSEPSEHEYEYEGGNHIPEVISSEMKMQNSFFSPFLRYSIVLIYFIRYPRVY